MKPKTRKIPAHMQCVYVEKWKKKCNNCETTLPYYKYNLFLMTTVYVPVNIVVISSMFQQHGFNNTVQSQQFSKKELN